MSVPFPSIRHPVRLQPPLPDESHQGDRFPSPLFLNYAQAVASCCSAFFYLLFTSYRQRSLGTRSFSSILGLNDVVGSVKNVQSSPAPQVAVREKVPNGDGTVNLDEPDKTMKTPWTKTLPVLLLQVSVFQTMAGPCGFLALRHISYPTMVLGKVRRGE